VDAIQNTKDKFPRTAVGGVSVSRMLIGTNWFLGYSHTSAAKDKFILDYQTRKNVADILTVFYEYGVDTMMGPPVPLLRDAMQDAEQRTGHKGILILTPNFDPRPNARPEDGPERAFDLCRQLGAAFCLPHTCVTDRLIDRMDGTIRNIGTYTKMIRARGMIPGLSTHMPEAIPFTDNNGYDIETYIQIYNALGFLMQVEVDWVMRLIRNAKKPVMTIKPMAAGRLLPPVGLAFSWATIRDRDMVTVGTTTPDEARECVEISLDILSRRLPANELQTTRSKKILETKA
jgi:hypothetical protein